jgi:hypothetical protein
VCSKLPHIGAVTCNQTTVRYTHSTRCVGMELGRLVHWSEGAGLDVRGGRKRPPWRPSTCALLRGAAAGMPVPALGCNKGAAVPPRGLGAARAASPASGAPALELRRHAPTHITPNTPSSCTSSQAAPRPRPLTARWHPHGNPERMACKAVQANKAYNGPRGLRQPRSGPAPGAFARPAGGALPESGSAPGPTGSGGSGAEAPLRPPGGTWRRRCRRRRRAGRARQHLRGNPRGSRLNARRPQLHGPAAPRRGRAAAADQRAARLCAGRRRPGRGAAAGRGRGGAGAAAAAAAAPAGAARGAAAGRAQLGVVPLAL